MASFAAKKAAITTAVTEELGSCRTWLVFITIVLETMSHMSVIYAAWMTTAYVIPVYLLLHFLIATQVTDLSVRQLLEAPLLWLFHGSRLIASSRPSAVKGARLCSWALRGAMALVFLIAQGEEIFWEFLLVYGYIDHSFLKFDVTHMCWRDPSHSCQGLPPWLQTPLYQTWWHGGSPTCWVDQEVYGSCVSERPWFWRGSCNWTAGV
eukprot:s4584_g2.t1